jgi:acyl carrier protein
MIRNALSQVSSLAIRADDLGDHDDLFAAGLSSFDLINLILCLEDIFGIEFPAALMSRDHFSSVAHIEETIAAIKDEELAP